MKRLLPFVIIVFLTSCGNTELNLQTKEVEKYPDPMEMEQKSLETGYRSDELFNHLKFGMNRREIFAYLEQEVKAGYVVITVRWRGNNPHSRVIDFYFITKNSILNRETSI